MKGWIVVVIGIVGFVGAVAGWSIGKAEYNRKLGEIIFRVKQKEGVGSIHSIEEIVEVFEKALAQKESEIKKLQAENDKTLKKLANLEEQFTIFLNEMIRQEDKKGRFSKEVYAPSTAQDKIEKKSPEELIKQINSLINNKDIDVVGIAKLLKQLVTYGKEYYQFVYDNIRKIFESGGRSGKFALLLGAIYKIFGSPEFVDYYKWVIENTDIESQPKIEAINGLLLATGEEMKPFLFEQFKAQTDPTMKRVLFMILSDSDEYKNTFIEVAKNLSEDGGLRRRIILEYRNDDSSAVQDLYSFLKSNETDPALKNIVNIISEVRNNKEKGYVVFKGGEIFKEKDIIIKIGEKEIPSGRSLGMFMPYGDSSSKKNTDENISVTLKRGGQIITVNVPKSKLSTELHMIEGIEIEPK